MKFEKCPTQGLYGASKKVDQQNTKAKYQEEIGPQSLNQIRSH